MSCVVVKHVGEQKRHVAIKAYEDAPELFFHEEVVCHEGKTYGSVVERSAINKKGNGNQNEAFSIVTKIFPAIANESRVAYMRGYFVVLNGYQDYPKGIHLSKEEKKDESE